MADKPFRILLDVTDLYLENFKYVWVNVFPRELKTISDFKKSVLRKINLVQENVQLFVRDGLLLDEETILVLREDDTVKIKYKDSPFTNLVKNSMKESNNFSRKRSLSESNSSDDNTNAKKYKPDVVTISSNGNESDFVERKSKKDKKRKQTESAVNSKQSFSSLVESNSSAQKNTKQSQITLVEKRKQTKSSASFENWHSVLEEENHLRKKSDKKKDKKKSSVTTDQTVTDINLHNAANDSFISFNVECTSQNKSNTSSKIILVDSENETVLINDSHSKEISLHENDLPKVAPTDLNSVGLNNKNKPKRKRKRSRKRKQSSLVNLSGSSDAVDTFKSVSENVNGNTDRKHISYLGPDRNQENNGSDEVRELQNPSTDTFVMKEDNSNIQVLDYPKVSTPAQSNNCGPLDWQLSLMPCKNSNLPYNENDSVSYEKSTTKDSSQSRERKSEKDLYEDLPDLTSLPVVGTYIAYKALELDDSYSPTVSDYREGKVQRINPETEEIEILLNKEIILPGRIGKFENLGIDEVPEPVVKTCDNLKWNDMISPKLFSYLPE